MRFTSKSLSDTRQIAEKILKELRPKEGANVLALSGDLGSGKTAFTKEFANLLGIPKEEVTSPTFVLMKIYDLNNPQPTTHNLQFKRLIHIDAYRIEEEKELVNLGWKEMVSDPENLILIEWPEIVPNLIPESALEMKFKFVDEETREIEETNNPRPTTNKKHKRDSS